MWQTIGFHYWIFKVAYFANNLLYGWFPMVFPSFLSVTSALSTNVLEGVYLQLYEMGLDQISVFTPLPFFIPYIPYPPNLLLPFHDDRKPSGAWRTPSQLALSRGNFLSNMWRLWFKCTSKELWSVPPPLLSIADKDNDCEVSEPSNVRQSLSSGSLL